MLAVSFSCLGNLSCKRTSQDEGKEQPSASSQEAPAPEPKKEDPGKDLDRELDRILTSKDPGGKKIGKLQIFLKNARAIEAKARRSYKAVARADRELKDLQNAQENGASKELREVEEKVNLILQADPPDFLAASALLNDFPIDRFQGSSALARLAELKGLVTRCQEAEMDFENRKLKLGDDPVKNIAILVGFDPKFEDTPFYPKVRALIDENYKKYVEVKEAELKRMETVKPLEIDMGNPSCYTLLWDTEYDCTEAKDGVLTVGPNKTQYLAKDPENAKYGTCIRIGGDDWIDYEIRFEAQVTSGEEVFFGARGHWAVNQNYEFYWWGLRDLEITDPEWHDFIVRIEGMTMRISIIGKKNTQKDNVGFGAGPFGIRVNGEKASIKLRKCQVRVLKKEAPPEGAKSSSDEGKKKKAPAKKKKG